MPRAEDSEPAEQVNPARRSRFSVAWLFGTSGSGADRADHDSLSLTFAHVCLRLLTLLLTFPQTLTG